MNGDAIKALRSEIRERRAELARYEQALALLEGAKPENGNTTAPKKPKKRPIPSKLGDERVKQIEAAIDQATVANDEFRQIDIRTMTGMSSSQMALGFEQLRQAGRIRFARKDGNNKWFRRTQTALVENEGNEENEESDEQQPE
jgi:hypothetical protein